MSYATLLLIFSAINIVSTSAGDETVLLNLRLNMIDDYSFVYQRKRALVAISLGGDICSSVVDLLAGAASVLRNGRLFVS